MRKGFTLIELLVVLAMIAILASIVLPAARIRAMREYNRQHQYAPTYRSGGREY